MTLNEKIINFLSTTGESASASRIQQLVPGSNRPIEKIQESISQLISGDVIKILEPPGSVTRYLLVSKAKNLAAGSWRHNHAVYASMPAVTGPGEWA